MRNSLSQSLWQYPLSHGLRRASSPKGTPFGNAGKFLIAPDALVTDFKSWLPPLGELARERLRGRISHVHTSFTSLLLSVLCCLWYTMVNMGHHGNIETDRM